MDNCTIDCIQIIGNYTYEQTCDFVKDSCIQDSVQFIQGYYCILHQSFFLLMIFGILFFMIFFKILNSITQNSLTPCVENIIVRFKISPTLAGITFLAFANGAPDVLTAVLAGQSSSQSTVLIPFGSIFGGCLFSTAFVLSAVIFQSPAQRFKVKMQEILVPLAFYIFGILFLITVSVTYGKMNIYIASVLIAVYLIFITLVLTTEKKRRREHLNTLVGTTQSDSISTISNVHNSNETIDQPLKQDSSSISFDQFQSADKLKSKQIQSKQNEQQNIINKWLNKLDLYIQILLLWVIPPRDASQWQPIRTIFSLVLSPLILGLSQDINQTFNSTVLSIPVIIYLSIPSLLLIIHTLICCYKRTKPIQIAFYTIYSFIVTIAWLTLVVGVLINMLELIQLLTNINSVFLGLTLIAWANTLGDYFSITVFAKRGRASTAVSGVFSGQLFNFLIGFGASLIIQSLDGQYQFDIFSFNGDTYSIISDSIVVFIISAGLIFLLLMFYNVITKKGVFNHRQGVIFRSYYVVVIIIALTLSISTDFFRQIQCDL